jgi:hypothetical protein
MKKIVLALSLIAIASGDAAIAGEIVNVTQVIPTIDENGKQVIDVPDKKATRRRRMLVDFGLFGAGIHIGWMKPKNYNGDIQQAGNGGEAQEPKRGGMGYPIFNLSAGSHAFGLGTK